MPNDTFKSFAGRVDKAIASFGGAELKKAMDRLGVEAKKDAMHAASMDLGGDPKFSGWPGSLDTRFDHVGQGRISFHPTPRSAGKWTVAEYGRHTGIGPPAVRLTKSGRVSRARVRKWNGRTAGKGTATEAVSVIQRETPQRAEAEIAKALKKAFG